MPWPAELNHRYAPAPLRWWVQGLGGGRPRGASPVVGLAVASRAGRGPYRSCCSGCRTPRPGTCGRSSAAGRCSRNCRSLSTEAGAPAPAVAEHLRSCGSCQAEQASYERLLRALRSMSEDLVLAAPGPARRHAGGAPGAALGASETAWPGSRALGARRGRGCGLERRDPLGSGRQALPGAGRLALQRCYPRPRSGRRRALSPGGKGSKGSSSIWQSTGLQNRRLGVQVPPALLQGHQYGKVTDVSMNEY